MFRRSSAVAVFQITGPGIVSQSAKRISHRRRVFAADQKLRHRQTFRRSKGTQNSVDATNNLRRSASCGMDADDHFARIFQALQDFRALSGCEFARPFR
jgi:hypothetical protein